MVYKHCRWFQSKLQIESPALKLAWPRVKVLPANALLLPSGHLKGKPPRGRSPVGQICSSRKSLLCSTCMPTSSSVKPTNPMQLLDAVYTLNQDPQMGPGIEDLKISPKSSRHWVWQAAFNVFFSYCVCVCWVTSVVSDSLWPHGL